MYQSRFPHISLGKPILCDDWDYAALAEAVWQEFPAPAEDEVVLLMGHGSETGDNHVYHRLTEEFLLTGHPNIFIGTMRDWSMAKATAEQWQRDGYHKVRLLPFLDVYKRQGTDIVNITVIIHIIYVSALRFPDKPRSAAYGLIGADRAVHTAGHYLYRPLKKLF